MAGRRSCRRLWLKLVVTLVMAWALSLQATGALSEQAPADGRVAPADGRWPSELAPADGRVAPADGRVAPADGRVAPADGRVAPADGRWPEPMMSGDDVPPSAGAASPLDMLAGLDAQGRDSAAGGGSGWPEAWDAGAKLAADRLWLARYLLYQGLISRGSGVVQLTEGGYLAEEDGTPLCLLHGRADVVANAAAIRGYALWYPDVPPVVVAAAIAEQASDVERAFGVDMLERTALGLPGWEDMSVGIAQIRPTEAISLGLGMADLFDPDIAVLGMYAKMQAGLNRIAAQEDPDAPLSVTERTMLLALAQNDLGSVDDYFVVDGDWHRLLGMHNHARIMRYFLVHLDWLVENGWEAPEEVDLGWWRRIAFSAVEPVSAE